MPCSLSPLCVSYQLWGSSSCAGGFQLQRSSEKWAEWIWFSLGLHVFGVTSFPHLTRFSGHNFPLCWPPYWWLGFLRRSRVKPGGRLSVHSPLQRPARLTCSERAFLLFTGRRKALLLQRSRPSAGKTGAPAEEDTRQANVPAQVCTCQTHTSDSRTGSSRCT